MVIRDYLKSIVAFSLRRKLSQNQSKTVLPIVMTDMRIFDLHGSGILEEMYCAVSRNAHDAKKTHCF